MCVWSLICGRATANMRTARKTQWKVCMGSAPQLNNTFANQGTTVFTVMSGLAVEHGAINLGQGFPDVDGPEEIRALAAKHLIGRAKSVSAYDRNSPSCVKAVADHNKRFYGLEYDWQSEDHRHVRGNRSALADCYHGAAQSGRRSHPASSRSMTVICRRSNRPVQPG